MFIKMNGFFVLLVVILCQDIANAQGNIYTPWGAWYPCSASCGGGYRWRERGCIDWSNFECSDLWQTSVCNTHQCGGEPVHGQWSAWGRWRSCTVTCGGGVQSRSRACNNPPPARGGRNCQGSGSQTRSCSTNECRPVHGQWSAWGTWSRCSVTCGGGVQSISRACNNPRPAHGGRNCQGSGSQTRRCSTNSCRCRVGQSVFDNCGQRCVCSSRGTLTQCTRIRREFTSMSAADRTRYINTIKRASTDRRYKIRYDRLLTLHRDIFFTGIHGLNHFLPWHRWFILQYENLLREVDCKFTVAYWDWSLVAGRPWGTSLRDLWHSGNSGFGGNGVAPRQCVRNGPFREQVWQLVPSADGPRCLRREFQGNPPTAVDVAVVLNINPSRFTNFESLLRVQLHDNVHCLIGGTMCNRDSASAPEFFLHHGFIDKIWDDWQRRSNAHRIAFFPSINQNMPGTTFRPGAFLNNLVLPGGVRAVYAPVASQQMRNMEGRLRTFSTAKLQRIPRIDPTPLLNSTIHLFKISNTQVKQLKKLMKELLKHRVRQRKPSTPNKIDVRLGFNHKFANS